MRLRLAVFDMVGTTVEAGDEVPASFRAALHAVGVTLSDEDLSGIRGRSKREAIAALLDGAGFAAEDEAMVDAVYHHFQEELRRAYHARVRPVPGAEDTLRSLIDRTAVVLITGLDRETVGMLIEGLGWDSLGLAGIVTGDDVERGRPAPDLLQAAMEIAKVEDPQSVLVVGDTTSDLEAAASAGVGWCVGVTSGAHSAERLAGFPHTVILDSVAQLPSWLGGRGL